MRLMTSAFQDNRAIPGKYAFAVPDPEQHVALSANKNPPFSWSDLPAGTRSLVLICHDPDVPSKPDDVNQEGRTVPADLPRVDFFHWVLVDVPADVTGLAEGAAGVYMIARSNVLYMLAPDALMVVAIVGAAPLAAHLMGKVRIMLEMTVEFGCDQIIETYEELVRRFPASTEARTARQLLDRFREKLLEVKTDLGEPRIASSVLRGHAHEVGCGQRL